MPKAPTWTKDEVAVLMHKREVEKKIWAVIGSEMGRSRTACHVKYEAIKRPRERVERVSYYCKTIISSEKALIERDRRAKLSPRNLTAEFFGDPLPGYSALDKRALA